MAKNIDVNKKNKQYNNSLMFAVVFKNKNTIKLLLKDGCDVNERDEYGNTALIYAADTESPDIIEMLLDAGADPDISNNTYPIIISAAKGSLDAVELFISRGADVNVRNHEGKTSMHLSLGLSAYSIIKALLNAGADPNIADNNGNTALMIQACWDGHTDIVRLLIEHGADVNARNIYGSTALYEAVFLGYKSISEILIKAGADINISVPDGYKDDFLLYHAVSSNSAETAALIMRYTDNLERDLGRKDINGDTVLHIAARNRHRLMFELLLKAGADFNVKNKKGITPFDILKEKALLRPSLKETVQLCSNIDHLKREDSLNNSDLRPDFNI